jgi:hypothetical protein
MTRALRFCVFLILQFVVALIGTAITEHTLWRVIPAHSISAIVRKEVMLSVLCAASIGFSMRLAWRNDVAKWVWVLPAMWFGFRIVFSGGSGGTWQQFSGSGCVNGRHSLGCENFFVFTIPFVRGVSYSLAAWAASLLLRGRRHAVSIATTSSVA